MKKLKVVYKQTHELNRNYFHFIFFFMSTYQKAFSRTWVFIYFLGIIGKVIINVCVALLFMIYLLNWTNSGRMNNLWIVEWIMKLQNL